jgi:hypothetical protein
MRKDKGLSGPSLSLNLPSVSEGMGAEPYESLTRILLVKVLPPIKTTRYRILYV